MTEIKHTYCRICEPNCGLLATVEDGKLVRIEGDKEHPISKGYICERGKATLDIHNDPDRIKYPYKRAGDKWERVTWDEAIKDIGRRIKAIRRKHGKHSVGLYFGNPAPFDFAFSGCLQMEMMAMKSRNIFSAGSQDCNNKFAATERIYGSPAIQPVPDIDNTDFLIIIGGNPAVSKMSFISLPRPEERLKAIEKRGGRIVIIDPRRTETARLMGEHIFIRPDTDMFLLCAMLHVIISEKLYSNEYVSKYASGFNELAKFVSNFPPQKAASVTGIDAAAIENLARDFAGTEKAAVYCNLGVNQGSFGTIGYWLVQSLNIITGHVDKKGCYIFCRGFSDYAMLYKLFSYFQKKPVSRIGGYPSVLGTLPAGIMADEILTPGKDQVKALIVLTGNPLMTVPDTEKLDKAFRSLDLMVSLDLFINETAAHAHYVLPSQDFYEHWDAAFAALMTNPVRYINYTEQVVKPEGERKPLWVGLYEIINAAGYPYAGIPFVSLITRPLERFAKLTGMEEPLFFRPKLIFGLMILAASLSFRKLKKGPQGMLLGEHTAGRFFKNNILTKDKKAQIAPPEFIAELNALNEHYNKETGYKGFKLIGQRQRHTHNSWFHNVKSFVEKEVTNKVSINPDDARELNISEGDNVTVTSATGSIKLPARITDTMMRRVVAVPHGWGHNRPSGMSVAKQYPGVNVNILTPSGPGALEKFAGQAKLTGIDVTVTKA